MFQACDKLVCLLPCEELNLALSCLHNVWELLFGCLLCCRWWWCEGRMNLLWDDKDENEVTSAKTDLHWENEAYVLIKKSCWISFSLILIVFFTHTGGEKNETLFYVWLSVTPYKCRYFMGEVTGVFLNHYLIFNQKWNHEIARFIQLLSKARASVRQ